VTADCTNSFLEKQFANEAAPKTVGLKLEEFSSAVHGPTASLSEGWSVIIY
jgi:hypothetical protein